MFTLQGVLSGFNLHMLAVKPRRYLHGLGGRLKKPVGRGHISLMIMLEGGPIMVSPVAGVYGVYKANIDVQLSDHPLSVSMRKTTRHPLRLVGSMLRI
jgi:hypothetical protein